MTTIVLFSILLFFPRSVLDWQMETVHGLNNNLGHKTFLLLRGKREQENTCQFRKQAGN